MTGNDLDAIAEIEHDSLSGWGRNRLEDELHQETGWAYVIRMATADDIIGFICGRSIHDEAELYKITIKKNARKQGIATILLNHVLDLLKQQGVKYCFLEVRASNAAALSLYRKKGFHQTGLRKNYYNEPAEDAIMMKTQLAP